MGDVALRIGDALAAAAREADAVGATAAAVAEVVEATAAALAAVARPAVAASARPLRFYIGEGPAEALPTAVEEKIVAVVEELKGQRPVVIEGKSSGMSSLARLTSASMHLMRSSACLAAVSAEGMVMQCVLAAALKAAMAWLRLPSAPRRPTAGSSRTARS